MYYEDAWPVTVYLKKTFRRGPGEAEGKGKVILQVVLSPVVELNRCRPMNE